MDAVTRRMLRWMQSIMLVLCMLSLLCVQASRSKSLDRSSLPSHSNVNSNNLNWSPVQNSPLVIDDEHHNYGESSKQDVSEESTDSQSSSFTESSSEEHLNAKIHKKEASPLKGWQERNDVWGLLLSSKFIAQDLKRIADEELALPTMQSIWDAVPAKIPPEIPSHFDLHTPHSRTGTFDRKLSSPKPIDWRKETNLIVNRISKKLNKYQNILVHNGHTLDRLYGTYLYNMQLESVSYNGYLPCCRRTINEFHKALKSSTIGTPTAASSSAFSFDANFRLPVSKHYSCTLVPPPLMVDNGAFIPGENFTQTMAANLAAHPSLKWQFFISTWGLYSEFPAYNDDAQCQLSSDNVASHGSQAVRYQKQLEISHINSQAAFRPHYVPPEATSQRNFNTRPQVPLSNMFQSGFSFNHHAEYMSEGLGHFHRHRDAYLPTVVPEPKHLMIVFDRGSSLSEHQLSMGKRVAQTLLRSLTQKDLVGFFALGDDVEFPIGDSCSLKDQLIPASMETQYHIARFIDLLDRQYNSTNHTLGLEQALNMIERTQFNKHDASSERPQVWLAYISRGSLSSLTDAKQIMHFLAKKMIEMNLPSDEDKSSKVNPVITINTYALIDDSKPVMYETTFLKDLANQNYKKYAAPQSKVFGSLEGGYHTTSGMMVPVNSTDYLNYGIGIVHSIFNNYDSRDKGYAKYIDSFMGTDRGNNTFSLPYWDPLSKSMQITITRPVFHRASLIGITGLDISLADIVEDLSFIRTSFPAIQDTKRAPHAYLVDYNTGLAVWHPLMKANFDQVDAQSGATMNTPEQPMYTSIELLEPQHFRQIQDSVLKHEHGFESLAFTDDRSHQVKMRKMSSSVDLRPDQLTISTVNYSWRRVPNTPYVVLLVSWKTEDEQTVNVPNTNSNNHNFEKQEIVPSTRDRDNYYYHRLDYSLASNSSLCRKFNQVVTSQRPALFLSSGAFVSPYSHQRESETRLSAQRYLVYLQDATNLIRNPGLKDKVKGHLATISKIGPIWHKIANLKNETEHTKYIVRRFMATQSGVFLVFPGEEIDKSYDPTSRSWYEKAIASPDKIVITSPYLDIGGAGYIVTLAHAIYSDSRSQQLIGVIGIDLTVGYFRKLIADYLPLCAQYPSISCFLMDDRGYLLSHPIISNPAPNSYYSSLKLSSPSSVGFYEDQHISQWEPLLTNDLLSRQELVQKLACNSLADGTIQRHYKFNTSYNDLVSNKIHAEICTRYQVVHIDGTNLFMGLINATCGEMLTAFCPCSITDKLCLNCHRFEPSECECPCECPLELNLCTGKFFTEEASNELCLPLDLHRGSQSQSSISKPYTPPNILQSLQECHPSYKCNNYLSEAECVGILGCEWCTMQDEPVDHHHDHDVNDKYDSGYETEVVRKPLSNGGFCSPMTECFGGLFGASPPYLQQETDLPLLSDGVFLGPSSSEDHHHLHHEYAFHPVSNHHHNSPVTIGPRFSLFIICALIIFVIAAFAYRVKTLGLRMEYMDHHSHHVGMLVGDDYGHNDRDALTSLPSPSSNSDQNNAPQNVASSILLSFQQMAAHMSPYRLNPNYRRPQSRAGSTGSFNTTHDGRRGGGVGGRRPEGGSDPGYSTMHDETDSNRPPHPSSRPSNPNNLGSLRSQSPSCVGTSSEISPPASQLNQLSKPSHLSRFKDIVNPLYRDEDEDDNTDQGLGYDYQLEDSTSSPFTDLSPVATSDEDKLLLDGNSSHVNTLMMTTLNPTSPSANGSLAGPPINQRHINNIQLGSCP